MNRYEDILELPVTDHLTDSLTDSATGRGTPERGSHARGPASQAPSAAARQPSATSRPPRGVRASRRNGGPTLTRARLALALKSLLAAALTATLLLSGVGIYVGLGLTVAFIAATVSLDYWVYRTVGVLAGRPLAHARREASDITGACTGLEGLLENLMSGSTVIDGLEVEAVRVDLYRLRDLNNQLIRLGDIARELNTALPFKETKVKTLELSRHLLTADVVALVSEEGMEFALEGVDGCEPAEIDVRCCTYYARCPVRSAFRDLSPAHAPDHTCSMFPPTMRSQLSLPFLLAGRRTMALVAAAARPDAFGEISPVVLEALVGHIQTSLSTALRHDRIRREVVTDPLTNLYNRRFFEQRAREEIERSIRHHLPVTLLMLDVDHFKRINDTYGHQTGDRVLQSVAQHLKESVRQSDICARYGGEEFILLLPATPGRNAVFLADRLRKGLGDLMHTGLGLPSHESVTVSGGVATCPRDATDVEGLIGAADAALYRAKDGGRNRIARADLPASGIPDRGTED